MLSLERFFCKHSLVSIGTKKLAFMTRASVSSSEYVSLFRPEMEHYVMRCNHTAVFLEPMIYVFGGSDGITAFNTLGAFNLDTRVWAEVPVEKVSPSCPCARTKHAACLVRWNHKDYLYIYGGIDGTRYLSDFWRCDLATGVFEEIHGVSQRSPPPALSSHCLARLGASELVLFGGVSNKQLSTQTWYYNLDTNTWSINPYRDCDQPEPCMGATLTTMVNNHCLLFGGISANGFLSHCWKLYPNHKWELLPVQKNGPMSRAFHCAVPVGEGRLLIHGGEYGKQHDQKLADTWILYETNRIWKRIPESDLTPQPRSNHAIVLWQSRSGNYRLFILGGRGREGIAAEFWCLNLSKAGLGREDYLQILSETQLHDGMHNYVTASGSYDVAADLTPNKSVRSGSKPESQRTSVSFNVPDQPLDGDDLLSGRGWTPTRSAPRRANSRPYAQMEDEVKRRADGPDFPLFSQQLSEAMHKVTMLTDAHNALSENMATRLSTLDRAMLELRNGGQGQAPMTISSSSGGPYSYSSADVAALRAQMENELSVLRAELNDGLSRAANIASSTAASQRQQTFHPEIIKSEIMGECRKLLQGELTKTQSEILTSARLQCNGVQDALKLDIDTAFETIKGINSTVQRLETSSAKYVLKTDVQSHELRILNLESTSAHNSKTITETRQAVSNINELLDQLSTQVHQFCEGENGRQCSMQEAVKYIVSYDLNEVQAKCQRMDSLLSALDTRTKELSELTDRHVARQDLIEKKLLAEGTDDVLKRDDTSLLFIQNTSAPVIAKAVGDLRLELTALISSLRDDLSKVHATVSESIAKEKQTCLDRNSRDEIIAECMVATKDLIEATSGALIEANTEGIRRMITDANIDIEGLRRANDSAEQVIEEQNRKITKLEADVASIAASSRSSATEIPPRDFGKSLSNASDLEVLFDKCYGYIDIIKDDLKSDSTATKERVEHIFDEYSERLTSCESRLADLLSNVETTKCVAGIITTGEDGVLSATSSFCSTPGGGDSRALEDTVKKLKSIVSRLTKEATASSISIKNLIDSQQKLGDEMLRLRQDAVGGSTKTLFGELSTRMEAMREELEKKTSIISSLEVRVALLEQTRGYTYDEIVAIFHDLQQSSSANKVASSSMININSQDPQQDAASGGRPINVSQSLLTTEHLQPKSDQRHMANAARRSSVQCTNAAVIASSLHDLVEAIPPQPSFNASAWKELLCVQRSIFDQATLSNMYFDKVSVDPMFGFVVGSDGAFLRIWKVKPLSRDDFNKASTIKGAFDIIAAEDVIECPGVTCSTIGGNLLCAGNDKGYLAAWPSVGDPYQLIAYPNGSVSCISVLADKERRCVVSGGDSGVIMEWSPMDGNSAMLGTHTAKATCADTCSSYALTGSRDCSAICWDLIEGRERARCLGHPDVLLSCYICKEHSELCVTGSADGTVRLWDMRLDNLDQGKAKSRCLFVTNSPASVTKGVVSVFMNRDMMISTCEDGSIKLWDIRATTPECVQTLTIDSGRILCSAVLNNSMIISADAGSLLALEFMQ